MIFIFKHCAANTQSLTNHCNKAELMLQFNIATETPLCTTGWKSLCAPVVLNSGSHNVPSLLRSNYMDLCMLLPQWK